ncbi:unnamed protein product [Sphagnum jensenii]|uniref:Homeobox domain-containing protein n=1 Tax=Sphagnum jensenii TaxID=128206 RepID=A0ABP1AUX9_9BRYO
MKYSQYNPKTKNLLLAGGFEDAVFGSGQKRPFYSSFEEPPGEEAGDEDGGDDCPHTVAKKRRLTFDQVRSLEQNFELENKLEPERKMQLAKELGLQPRQVAVWYQNRRARWKTKQLERDYEVLSSDYNRLKAEFEVAVQEKEKLKSEVQRFSGKNELPGCEAVEVSLSESEITTYTSHEQALVMNSVPIKSERISKDDQQLVEIRASQWRASSTVDNMSASIPKDHQKELCTSSESNSSELLETGSSPRSTIDSNKLSVTAADQQANNNINNCPREVALAESFVDPVLLRPANDLCGPRALLPPREYQRSAIKLEDGNDHEDQSCNYFLSQLDDKGCIPWWDWS